MVAGGKAAVAQKLAIRRPHRQTRSTPTVLLLKAFPGALHKFPPLARVKISGLWPRVKLLIPGNPKSRQKRPFATVDKRPAARNSLFAFGRGMPPALHNVRLRTAGSGASVMV